MTRKYTRVGKCRRLGDEDFELLEAAATLPDALYGSRLYSNTAIYALATQRELYEAKIAELEAKLSLLASPNVEDQEPEIARRPLRRDARGIVATVFALVFAICFLVELNLEQRKNDEKSRTPRVASVIRTPKDARPAISTPADQDQLARATASSPDIKTSSTIRSQEVAAHPHDTRRVETATIERRPDHFSTGQLPVEKPSQVGARAEQVALSDNTPALASSMRSQDEGDELGVQEPARSSNPTPDAVRRFKALDALHALRMR